jgi:hypothetical protein
VIVTEFAEGAVAHVACGNAVRRFFDVSQQDVVIEGQMGCVREIDVILTGEGLEGVAIDIDGFVLLLSAAALSAANIAVLDAVGAVILSFEPEDAGLELHVDVLGDEDSAILVGVGEVDTAGEDAVVAQGEVGEESLEFGEARGFGKEMPAVIVELELRIDANVKPAAVFEADACLHLLSGAKALAQSPVNLARVGPPSRALGFEAIEFLEDFNRDMDLIVLELEHRLRIVQEHIRIEDVVFGRRDFVLLSGHWEVAGSELKMWCGALYRARFPSHHLLNRQGRSSGRLILKCHPPVPGRQKKRGRPGPPRG